MLEAQPGTHKLCARSGHRQRQTQLATSLENLRAAPHVKRTKLCEEALPFAVTDDCRLVHVHQPAGDAAKEPVAVAARVRRPRQIRGHEPARLTYADGTMCGSYCRRSGARREREVCTAQQPQLRVPQAHLLQRVQLSLARAQLGELPAAASRMSGYRQCKFSWQHTERTEGIAPPRLPAAASCAQTGGSGSRRCWRRTPARRHVL